MGRKPWRIWSAGASAAVAAMLVTSCTHRTRESPPVAPAGTAASTASAANNQPPGWIAKMDSGRVRFSPADVELMQGMIHHRAQAILMSAWAPTHGASRATAG